MHAVRSMLPLNGRYLCRSEAAGEAQHQCKHFQCIGTMWIFCAAGSAIGSVSAQLMAAMRNTEMPRRLRRIWEGLGNGMIRVRSEGASEEGIFRRASLRKAAGTIPGVRLTPIARAVVPKNPLWRQHEHAILKCGVGYATFKQSQMTQRVVVAVVVVYAGGDKAVAHGHVGGVAKPRTSHRSRCRTE